MKAKYIKKSLGSFRRVHNMESSKGNDVPNQFILYFENGEVFQSYRSIIAIKFYNIKENHKLNNRRVLGRNWDYSATTGKYRNNFLYEGIAETRLNIKNKKYIYCEELV